MEHNWSPLEFQLPDGKDALQTVASGQKDTEASIVGMKLVCRQSMLTNILLELQFESIIEDVSDMAKSKENGGKKPFHYQHYTMQKVKSSSLVLPLIVILSSGAHNLLKYYLFLINKASESKLTLCKSNGVCRVIQKEVFLYDQA